MRSKYSVRLWNKKVVLMEELWSTTVYNFSLTYYGITLQIRYVLASGLSEIKNYFRETRGILRLVELIPMGNNAGHWPSQRANHTVLILAVARILSTKGGAETLNNQVHAFYVTELTRRKH